MSVITHIGLLPPYPEKVMSRYAASLPDYAEDLTALPTPPKEPPRRDDVSPWLQVVGGFFMFMNTWGVINAYGVFQTYYGTDMLKGMSQSSIAWIGTSTSFLLCASPIIFGPIFDLGYARALMLTGSTSIIVGLVMTSLCHTYWQFLLAQGICIGLGGGCAFVTAVSVLPAYFVKERALAMGLAASGSSIGGIMYPIMFHRLQPMLGFAWSVRCIALCVAGTLAITCAVVKPRSQPSARRKILDTAILMELDFEVFNMATFLGFTGQYIPFFFIQTYAQDHGLELAFWMLIFLNLGSLPGRIVPSLVADRLLPPLLVLCTCTACAAILAFCWILIRHSTTGLVVWGLLYGFFSGAFVSLQPAAVASMTTDLSTIGTRFGLNMFCGALGILIGSPVGGAIFPSSWPGAQAFCGGTLVLSSCTVALTILVHRRRSRYSTT